MQEIVIKIPEGLKDVFENNRSVTALDVEEIRRVIINGTVLPKGHGRLGDLGKIYTELNEAQIEGTEEYKGLGKAKQIICNAKTIIEADRSEE